MKEAAEEIPGVITRVCDLSVEKERAKLYQWIVDHHPDLDVLVNNVGIQQWMDVTDPILRKSERRNGH